MKFKWDSIFIDLANEAIDKRLAKRLTLWCSSKEKLVVGCAEYKRIIEMNLGITCVYVDVPHDEVIHGLKNPIHTLLPGEKSKPAKKDRLPKGEGIIFLRRYDVDVKHEMVDKSVVEAAQRVHRIELHQKEHLKFLRIF
uniref:Uncharacterized protein n=1 Tax=Avena sativa TaxID=4498 RepID=A0ACD5XHU9_AVESA